MQKHDALGLISGDSRSTALAALEVDLYIKPVGRSLEERLANALFGIQGTPLDKDICAFRGEVEVPISRRHLRSPLQKLENLVEKLIDITKLPNIEDV